LKEELETFCAELFISQVQPLTAAKSQASINNTRDICRLVLLPCGPWTHMSVCKGMADIAGSSVSGHSQLYTQHFFLFPFSKPFFPSVFFAQHFAI
jgi:hypothetical protein